MQSFAGSKIKRVAFTETETYRGLHHRPFYKTKRTLAHPLQALQQVQGCWFRQTWNFLELWFCEKNGWYE